MTKPMTKPQNNNKNTESKTLDAQKRSRFTDKLTLKMDPETKRAMMKFVEQRGLSMCQTYDALTKAFLEGCKTQHDLGVQSPTINLSIERVVARPRRYDREVEDHRVVEESGAVLPVKGPRRVSVWKCNFYDGKATAWMYKPDAQLNILGHAVGCACSECRKLGR